MTKYQVVERILRESLAEGFRRFMYKHQMLQEAIEDEPEKFSAYDVEPEDLPSYGDLSRVKKKTKEHLEQAKKAYQEYIANNPIPMITPASLKKRLQQIATAISRGKDPNRAAQHFLKVFDQSAQKERLQDENKTNAAINAAAKSLQSVLAQQDEDLLAASPDEYGEIKQFWQGQINAITEKLMNMAYPIVKRQIENNPKYKSLKQANKVEEHHVDGAIQDQFIKTIRNYDPSQGPYAAMLYTHALRRVTQEWNNQDGTYRQRMYANREKPIIDSPNPETGESMTHSVSTSGRTPLASAAPQISGEDNLQGTTDEMEGVTDRYKNAREGMYELWNRIRKAYRTFRDKQRASKLVRGAKFSINDVKILQKLQKAVRGLEPLMKELQNNNNQVTDDLYKRYTEFADNFYDSTFGSADAKTTKDMKSQAQEPVSPYTLAVQTEVKKLRNFAEHPEYFNSVWTEKERKSAKPGRLNTTLQVMLNALLDGETDERALELAGSTDKRLLSQLKKSVATPFLQNTGRSFFEFVDEQKKGKRTQSPEPAPALTEGRKIIVRLRRS